MTLAQRLSLPSLQSTLYLQFTSTPLFISPLLTCPLLLRSFPHTSLLSDFECPRRHNPHSAEAYSRLAPQLHEPEGRRSRQESAFIGTKSHINTLKHPLLPLHLITIWNGIVPSHVSTSLLQLHLTTYTPQPPYPYPRCSILLKIVSIDTGAGDVSFPDPVVIGIVVQDRYSPNSHPFQWI